MHDFPEIRTLIFTLTGIIVCRAAAMGYVWIIARRFKPVQWWACGSTFVGAGALLIGLRDIVSPLISILLGQTLVVFGWLLIDSGTILATGRKVPWRFFGLLTLAAIAGVTWFEVVENSFRWRTVFVTVPEILFDLYAGVACFRANGKLRGTLHLLGGAVVALAISNGIKLHFVFDGDVNTLFLPAWQISQFYIVAIAVTVFGTILSVLLATQHVQEKLRQELAAHRNAEESLSKALLRAEQFRLALDNVPSIVYIKDLQSRFTYANRHTFEFLKCTPQELIGTSGQQYLPPDIREKVLESDKAVFGGDTLKKEIRISIGQDDYRVYVELKTPVYDGSGSKEIIALCGIATDITDIKLRERLLEQVAHIDSLTGLPNRMMLDEVLEKALAGSERRQLALGIAYIDLDGFKAVNDQLGHEAGDQLLKAVAGQMSKALRKGDILARVGGDEFIAVLVDIDRQGDSDAVMQRLLDAASSPVMVGEKPVKVSASLGLALFPSDGAEARQLIRRADEAMYRAKQQGKNRYVRYKDLPAV